MSVILVTGGAGYIGAQVCRLLAAAGHRPVVVDDLRTGHASNVRFGPLERVDVSDEAAIRGVLAQHRPEACIHLAASCYVGESHAEPERYHANNVVATASLLRALADCGVRRLVFSSSCAVYTPASEPLAEDAPLGAISPYGRTKAEAEALLRAAHERDGVASVALRFFNAAGAAGGLGEAHDPETHLVPLVLDAAAGQRSAVEIYGDDYDTPDGTCVRDYVHVEDIARAHLDALRWLEVHGGAGVFNLGTGVGHSVREVVATCVRVTGQRIATRLAPRRPGDAPRLVADARRARRELGWTPRHETLEGIVRSAWEHRLAIDGSAASDQAPALGASGA